MGLFDRIWRVVKANINSLVAETEDPEKILEQTVMDMQENLIQLRQAVAHAIATQKRTERQCSQSQSHADEWYRRAQLALQKGEENLAREALTRRNSYQQTAQAMQAQIEQQTQVVAKLRQDMRSLEGKIAEARMKKDLYIARARSAQATQKLQEMLGNINTGSSLNAFAQMEEKISQLEAKNEAIAELEATDLEKRFISLQAANDIDKEISLMKAQTVADLTGEERRERRE